MKNLNRFAALAVVLSFVFSFQCCEQPATDQSGQQDSFSFVFMTDIHLQPESNAPEGFMSAINKVNSMGPDFVITGGDLIMDALGVSYERADSLYNMYNEAVKSINMPIHNTIGNHEVYGWYASAGADTNHPEYGKLMFEKRLEKRYRTFEFKGWKFFIFDSVIPNGKGGYEGGIDREQLAWIKEVLAETDSTQPIIISTHIPLLTTEAQILRGAAEANYRGEVITNSKEVMELFEGYNLKLVLQGHLHYYEDIYVWGTRYITGGAVSGRWWTGPYLKTEEGFMMIRVNGDDFEYEFVDYGWEVVSGS